MGQRRSGRAALSEKPADRLSLVEPERRDVDQAGDVRRVGAERGHDLAAAGVAGDIGRAVLVVQYLAQPGDVIGQRDSGNWGAVTW